MVLILANPSEDSQGTQLRVNKKLTTVCSGKRSRFSKPRPNLSISKRGETNITTNADKTSKSSEPEVSQTVLDLNTNSNDKSLNKDAQNYSSNTDIEKKPLNGDVLEQKSSSYIDYKKTVEENIKVLSEDNILNLEDKIENIPCEDAANKIVLEECAQVIKNTNSEILNSEEIISCSDKIECEISNTENISPDEESQAFSKRETGNKTKDCDIILSPVKSSGPSLKSSEPEKRNASNITPTVIDKSKYPHLTSILSKKRTEPKKEAQQKRRRKFKKGDAPPERSKMTMADLIYWNPAKTDEPPKSTVVESEIPSTNLIIEEEENIEDSLESENNIIDSVPKLVISEDGQINIDQSSLFVSRNIPQPTTTEVVRKDDTTYSSFRKRPLTKHWTDKDTANFYRALSLVGADFSLMEQIFPKRTRRELKQKFKREEKFNIDLINKALYESETFDELDFDAFIDEINAADDPASTYDKDADVVVKEKSRKKRTSKKTESSNKETCDSPVYPEEIPLKNEKAENKKKKNEKAKKLSDDEDFSIILPENTKCNITLKNENTENKKKKKKSKKLSDDEDVDIVIPDNTNYSDTGELKSSKRKRIIRKLPDDFVSIDSVEELDIWGDLEASNQEILDASEKENTIESQENGIDIETEKGSNVEAENDVAEISSESACVILNKIMDGTEIADNEQNQAKKVCNVTVSIPVVTNHVEELISVEYIENDDLESNLGMLNDVVAYEVVNTQIAPPRKRRKLNSISPQKTRDLFLSTKISPANYTNYTPV